MMAEKHPCDIWKVAGQCGVRLLDPVDHRPGRRKPRQCFSKRTLKKIGQRYGEAHLALVLRLIVETSNNAGELYSETLHAISALLITDPGLLDRGGGLFDDFDEISLAEIRRQAKAMTCGLPAGHVMRVLLAIRLHRPEQGDMLDLIKGSGLGG